MITVTSKGQVTIPKRVRDLLGIGPGSEVEFKLGDDGDVVLIASRSPRPPSKFAKLRGSLPSDMATDEIMALLRGED
jgi:AbrB family looped-hinge helix DNA binding protein